MSSIICPITLHPELPTSPHPTSSGPTPSPHLIPPPLFILPSHHLFTSYPSYYIPPHLHPPHPFPSHRTLPSCLIQSPTPFYPNPLPICNLFIPEILALGSIPLTPKTQPPGAKLWVCKEQISHSLRSWERQSLKRHILFWAGSTRQELPGRQRGLLFLRLASRGRSARQGAGPQSGDLRPFMIKRVLKSVPTNSGKV